MKQHRVK